MYTFLTSKTLTALKMCRYFHNVLCSFKLTRMYFTKSFKEAVVTENCSVAPSGGTKRKATQHSPLYAL